MKRLHFLFLLLLNAAPAGAAERTSAHYSILAEVTDLGGRRATSARYTLHGSAGTIGGTSLAGTPVVMAKAGYPAQLYEIMGIVVNAAPASVNEGGTRQLDPAHLLDDATLIAINPALVTWIIDHGPIVSISPGGLATGGLVPQDTPALVKGRLGLLTAGLPLTVLNTIPDNFGAYAGDGLNDDWQVQHFGLPPNPAAAPLLDPDGDGQNNRFEFLAGLIPTDPASVFRQRVARSAQGTQVIFSPIISGRTYAVTFRSDLSALPAWAPLPPGMATFQNGDELTVIDSSAHAAPQRYYRVEITPLPPNP